ncbi:hypothetical protein PFISCL1PPCAC_4776, partial [Pristionchus fissidentatus]
HEAAEARDRERREQILTRPGSRRAIEIHRHQFKRSIHMCRQLLKDTKELENFPKMTEIQQSKAWEKAIKLANPLESADLCPTQAVLAGSFNCDEHAQLLWNVADKNPYAHNATAFESVIPALRKNYHRVYVTIRGFCSGGSKFKSKDLEHIKSKVETELAKIQKQEGTTLLLAGEHGLQEVEAEIASGDRNILVVATKPTRKFTNFSRFMSAGSIAMNYTGSDEKSKAHIFGSSYCKMMCQSKLEELVAPFIVEGTLDLPRIMKHYGSRTIFCKFDLPNRAPASAE